MCTSSGELERCGCPACGTQRPPRSRYTHGPFSVVRCGSCRLWYLSPRLSQDAIQAHYEAAGYFEGGDAGYSSYAHQERSLRLTFRRLLRRMKRRGWTGGTLLEIGCGYGYFLEEARGFFERRTGTEMAPEACERARRRADDIYPGGIDQVPATERFHCIVALQVIEHIYDPLDFVRALASRLEVGGTLVLSTPDMGSFWRALMGGRWASFKYPEHVAFYDSRTLPALMREAGLAELQRVPHPHAFPAGEVLAKLGFASARRWLPGSLWVPATTLAFAGRRTGR
ncbi:MAG: class I SAM-dependent methyltransferase [Myxococcota bacterium]